MKTFRIALYPGDGIGKDVLAEGVRVLEAVQAKLGGFALDMTLLPWGCDYCEAHGVVAPADYLEQLKAFDAIYLGAIGDPRRVRDHISLIPLVHIRQRFDQYACVRPARLYPSIPTPLANPGTVDLVVVRENSEGEYLDVGGRVRPERPEEAAIQTAVHTRAGVERILRFGFDLAKTRRKKLTMITKSNALQYSMVLWDDVLASVRGDYPDIEADKLHVDAAAMNFVRWPDRFDVVVASNLFGDILSDVAGVITGGLGLAPSANINPERTFPSMFEPVHGSAPDIDGQGIANPIAMILSGAMMLDWLGISAGGEMIRSAVEATLAGGAATPDLGGTLSTTQMADRVIGQLTT